MTTPQGGNEREGRVRASDSAAEPVASLRVPREFRAAFGEALGHAEKTVGGEDPAKRSLATLRDISTSFKAHAEVLDSILETQRRLLGAIGRADRSEMMVQSTQALNETFRAMMATQRELGEKLAATGNGGGSRPRAGTLLLSGLLFALASAGLVASAVLWGGGGSRARDEAGAASEARLALLEEKLAASADFAGMSASFHDLADSMRTGTGEVEKLVAATTKLSVDLDAERVKAQELLEKSRRFEKEIEELTRSLVDANMTSDGFRAKYLEAEERVRSLDTERADLASRIRDAGAIPGSSPVGQSSPSPESAPSTRPEAVASTEREEGSAAAASAPPAATAAESMAPAEAAPDPERLAAWRDSLNRLLAARSGADRYEVESLREVASGVAKGVKIRKLSGEGTVKSYEAETLRAFLDEKNRWVEFRLEDGQLHYAGRSIPFLNGRFSFMVMEVDGGDWKRAALPFLSASADAVPPAVLAPPAEGPPPVGSRKENP